jgi:hypothetical protein
MININKIKISSSIMLFLALALNSPLRAQHLEITPFIGYETGGKVHTSLGYLRVADGMNFGGALSFGITEKTQLEFTYNHLNSELSLDEGAFISNKTDVNVDYYMLGVLKAVPVGERVRPYGSFSASLVNYGTPDDYYDNEVLMAVNMAAGLKILITERIGIRMQARINLPLYYTGMYFSFGSGGSGYGIASTCIMVQGDFTAALYFVLR